jgi:hypothetical protein
VNNRVAKARDCRAFALRLAKPASFLQNNDRHLGTANDCRLDFRPLDVGAVGLGGETGIVAGTRFSRETTAGYDAWV